MNEQKQLSLCIISKNDDAFFPRCLKEMEGAADEMLVIDLGLGEHALELAKQAGATVYRLKWEDDFSKIKNFCMDHAMGKWVLFLQADEVISREQHKELKILLQNPAAEGYLINGGPRQKDQNVFSPAQLLRLIRNRDNYRFCHRSFEYIPDEELYSIQSCGLRIAHYPENAAGWQMAERIRLLQTDLKEHPQDGYLQYLKGIGLLNEGKYKESAASLELTRHAFSGGYLYVPHMYKCLGICLMSLERYNVAEDVLSEGFWLFPFYTDLLILRAELYCKLGRAKEALKDLEICTTLQNSPNACVPLPEIDISVTETMLEKIRAGLNAKF